MHSLFVKFRTSKQHCCSNAFVPKSSLKILGYSLKLFVGNNHHVEMLKGIQHTCTHFQSQSSLVHLNSRDDVRKQYESVFKRNTSISLKRNAKDHSSGEVSGDETRHDRHVTAQIRNLPPVSPLHGTNSHNNDFPWMKGQVPFGYWGTFDNQRRFLTWLSTKLGVKHWEDWYVVSKKDIDSNKGRGLLLKYKDSPSLLLMTVFPEHRWQPWRFRSVPEGCWDVHSNQLEFMESLGKKLGVKEWEDWYTVSAKDIGKHGGWGLLHKFQNSPSKLLMSVFPDRPWQVWRFARLPDGYWEDPANLRLYFEQVGQLLGKSTQQHWETTSHHSLLRYKGATVFKKIGTLAKALKVAYPERQWNFPVTSQGQRYLKEAVTKVCKDIGIGADEVLEEYTHPSIRHELSNKCIELDLYIPRLKLAFEYQGEQHAKQTHKGNVRKQLERDNEKKQLCEKHGITLICIHHRWSGLIEDLKATIHSHANHVFGPDFKPSGKVISLAPKKVTKKLTKGKILFMLPTVYKANLDPTDWWISEKYDGFRVMWLGKKQYFVTKENYVIVPPQFIAEQLPSDMDLDGELWKGRGNGDEVRGLALCADSAGPEEWQDAKFMVFDYKPETEDHPLFEERMQILMEKLAGDKPNVQSVTMTKCTGYDHLHATLASIIEQGGEGLMLRQPKSRYVSGARAYEMQKMKQRYFMQAVIEDIKAVQTTMGLTHEIHCITPQGIKFGLRRPPARDVMNSLIKALNSNLKPVITVQYYGISRNQKPWLSTCVRYHPGVTWESLVWYEVSFPVEEDKISEHSENAEKLGKKVTCYSCRQPIYCKEELRVVTNAIYAAEARGGFMPMTLSFHATPACLKDRLYHDKIGKRANTLPPFENIVAIDASLQHIKLPTHLKQQLELLEKEGIAIKYQRSFPLPDETQGNTLTRLIVLMNRLGIYVDLEQCYKMLSNTTYQKHAKYLLDHAQFSDMKNIGKIEPSWHLYPNFLIASSHPSITTIPKEIRPLLFVPFAGHVFLSVDFNQCDLRIFGNVCKEGKLHKLLSSGEDVATCVASQILQKPKEAVTNNERECFKCIVLAIAGGSGVSGVIGKLKANNILDVEEEKVHKWRDEVLQIFATEIQYKKSLIDEARRQQKATTLAGHEFPLDNNATDTAIWDILVQTSANQLVAHCFALVWTKLQQEGVYERCGIAWVVRDELVFEVKENDKLLVEKLVKKSVETVSINNGLSIPLSVRTTVYSKPQKTIQNAIDEQLK